MAGLLRELLHERTTSAQRSTTVSAASLVLMLGGGLGSLLLPRLAEAAGDRAGLLAGAGCLLLMAVLSLGRRSRRTADGAPAPVGGAAAG